MWIRFLPQQSIVVSLTLTALSERTRWEAKGRGEYLNNIRKSESRWTNRRLATGSGFDRQNWEETKWLMDTMGRF
jgi:hypothetical protein